MLTSYYFVGPVSVHCWSEGKDAWQPKNCNPLSLLFRQSVLLRLFSPVLVRATPLSPPQLHFGGFNQSHEVRMINQSQRHYHELIHTSNSYADTDHLKHTNTKRTAQNSSNTNKAICRVPCWRETKDVFFDEYGKPETEHLTDYGIAELVQQIQATTDTTSRWSLQTKLMEWFVDKRRRFFQKDFATGKYQQITPVAAMDISLASCLMTARQGDGRPSFPLDDPKDNQADQAYNRSTTTSRKRKAQRLSVDKPRKSKQSRAEKSCPGARREKCKTTDDVYKTDLVKPPRYDHIGCCMCVPGPSWWFVC